MENQAQRLQPFKCLGVPRIQLRSQAVALIVQFPGNCYCGEVVCSGNMYFSTRALLFSGHFAGKV